MLILRTLFAWLIAGAVCLAQPKLPPPSAVVKLDLETWPIRLICLPDETIPFDLLRVDLGVNETLITTPTERHKPQEPFFKLVKTGLPLDEEFLHALPANVPGVEVGLKFKLRKRAKAVVLEIWPQYSLPSGDIEGFSISRASQKNRKLQSLYSQATVAERRVPGMRSELRVVASRLQSRSGASSSQAASMVNHSLKLQRAIAKGERLIANKDAIYKDLKAFEAVSEYGKKISPTAELYVRLHAKDLTQRFEEKD